jgi:hypothetical protein
MATPFVYFKVPETNTVVMADITSMIMSGETISSIVLGSVNPVSTVPLVATITSGILPGVLVNLAGGNDGTSYGFKLTVTTSARVFLVSIAVTVADQSFIPYTTSNPEAYQDLVDEIEAGKAAIGSAVFMFPSTVMPIGGFVTWELLASDGTVYAAGNAYEYVVQSNGISNTVVAKSVINVPITVPPSLDSQRYQLRYTLELPQSFGTPTDPTLGSLSQNTFFQFEGLRVVGLNTVPLGTQPSVELQGVPATISIVLDRPYDNVTVELYSGNNLIAPASQIVEYQRTANGWYFAGVIDTSQLQASLLPYALVWKYWSSTNSAMVYQEQADFWVVNPSIMGAISDVKAKVSKARTTLYGTPDLIYSTPTILTWLRRGGDAFNAAYGQFTSITFVNALGPVREFWLLEAEMAALQSQYLAEGEKAFNFQGAAISLDVDRTQYLDNAEGKIQARLDNELKAIKVNLIIKGNTSGDGSANVTSLQPGAIGAVGITITPASMFGRYGPGYIGALYR